MTPADHFSAMRSAETAYLNGYHTAMQDDSRTDLDNPNKVGTVVYTKWLQGFEDALCELGELDPDNCITKG